MAGALNIDNDTSPGLSHDGIDSNTVALSEESTTSGAGIASCGEQRTGRDHGSDLGEQTTPRHPTIPGSQLSTQSDDAQDFLLTGIGGLGYPDPGLRDEVTGRPEYPDTIQDELLTSGDVGERHLQRQLGSREDPWSGVDFRVPDSSLHGLVPSFWSRSGCLTSQTQLLIKHIFDSNPTGCVDHIESNCFHPHQRRHIAQRMLEALYAISAAVAIMTVFTLQAHGLQLTWMIIYGLVLLLAAVLVVMRMLF